MKTFDFGDGNGPVPAHRHPWGGGWVADTATVHRSVYVNYDARVYGHAMVLGKATLWANARVFGLAKVFGNASVNHNACVCGSAEVFDEAFVWENALVMGSASVSGFANVSGNAQVYDNALVFDRAVIGDNVRFGGNAIARKKARIEGSVVIETGVYDGGDCATVPKPRRSGGPPCKYCKEPTKALFYSVYCENGCLDPHYFYHYEDFVAAGMTVTVTKNLDLVCQKTNQHAPYIFEVFGKEIGHREDDIWGDICEIKIQEGSFRCLGKQS